MRFFWIPVCTGISHEYLQCSPPSIKIFVGAWRVVPPYIMINIDKNKAPYLAGWLALGVGSLVIAGFFALLIALTRTPLIRLLSDHLTYQRALTGHVTFALLVWFLTFIAAFYARTASINKYPASPVLNPLAFYFSLAGTVLLVVPVLFSTGSPLMHDYVPVIDSPLFALGLITVAIGFLLATVNYLQAWWRGRKYSESPESIGLATSGLCYIIALIILVVTLFRISGGPGWALKVPETFWGTGHVLQFVYTSAMISVMYLIMRSSFGLYPIANSAVRFTFVLYGVAALSFLYYYLANEPAHLVGQRSFFGLGLMGLGLGLPTLIHGLLLFKGWKELKNRIFPWENESFVALVLAIGLFIAGGFIALLGLGPDTRVPAHYHAMVGAVTLTFMGIVPGFLRETERIPFSLKMTRYQPYLYGFGILSVSLTMAWAGLLGAPRKIIELGWANAPALLALNFMGLGSLLAMAGGVLFVLNIGIPLIRNKNEMADVKISQAGKKIDSLH